MAAHKANILLAEDDDDDFYFFKDALKEINKLTSLTRVKNGMELLELLKCPEAVLPDIIFLDINMPGKNGYDCLKEIRKTERWMDVPVVIISTSMDENIINKMFSAGASRYICKPNYFNALVEHVQHILRTNKKKLLMPCREQFAMI